MKKSWYDIGSSIFSDGIGIDPIINGLQPARKAHERLINFETKVVFECNC